MSMHIMYAHTPSRLYMGALETCMQCTLQLCTTQHIRGPLSRMNVHHGMCSYAVCRTTLMQMHTVGCAAQAAELFNNWLSIHAGVQSENFNEAYRSAGQRLSTAR
eukprot:1162027-Pelagomonas_calceolata.AAC.2